MRTLLPNEEELLKISKLTLTNIRVLYSDQNKDRSVMLEHITSIENEYRSYYRLLILSVLSGIAGFPMLGNFVNHLRFAGLEALIMLFLSMIPATIFLFLFFRIKRSVLIIKSSDSDINVKMNPASKDEILFLMDKIELAKNKLLTDLNN